MGLYLLGKKVGYLFTDLALDPNDNSRAIYSNVNYLKATLGGHVSERKVTQRRTYESKPNGKLISLVIEQQGDGGDQTMEGTATSDGVHVTIRHPGQTNQVKNLPPARETVEDADQWRVALLRHTKVEGLIIDGMDLDAYRVTTTVERPDLRMIAGINVPLSHLRTFNEKDKIPVDAYVTQQGATVEVDFGQTLKGVTEPAAVAQRLDDVEIFALTGVDLPKPLPANVRDVPNSVMFVVSGLPESFRKDDYRQKFKALPEGRVALTVTAAAPVLSTPATLPLEDPAGGVNLRNSLVMELDDPDIVAAAHRVVGDEKDAYRAAKRIAGWVGTHMRKDYGASSDRAADALHAMRGDCTEHSLLTVAMMRAVGIPAKRIDGLIYMPDPQGLPRLYWHEWVEAYVGEWTQLDPTWDEPVADAAHIALGEEAHQDVITLMGQLKVLDVGMHRL
jgi:hypothetical protein